MDASLLAGWDNFYVIIGSAAAGLTGLTFVVIALSHDAGPVRPDGIRAFVTPTIVHFGGVLALAAYVSMPHQHVATLSAGFLVGGAVGVAYGLHTARNLRKVDYVPVREDWVWNVIVPTLAYATLLGLGILVWHRAEAALFGVGGLAVMMLFVGIRNAWDIAVWMSLSKEQREQERGKT